MSERPQTSRRMRVRHDEFGIFRRARANGFVAERHTSPKGRPDVQVAQVSRFQAHPFFLT